VHRHGAPSASKKAAQTAGRARASARKWGANGAYAGTPGHTGPPKGEILVIVPVIGPVSRQSWQMRFGPQFVKSLSTSGQR